MSAITSLFGGGSSSAQREQLALQKQQLARQTQLQDEQRRLVREKEDRTKLAEEAQRRVRGRRRGLFAYMDGEETLGGAY